MTEIAGNGAGAVDANVRWAMQAVRTIARSSGRNAAAA